MTSAQAIQEKVLLSLKEEFKAAADTVHQAALSRVDQALSDENTSPFIFESDYLQKDYMRIQFLRAGAKGRYGKNNYAGVVGSDLDLWGRYLESISRLGHSSRDIERNIRTINHLIRQNGPKKMEHRLRQFLRRRIRDALGNPSPK